MSDHRAKMKKRQSVSRMYSSRKSLSSVSKEKKEKKSKDARYKPPATVGFEDMTQMDNMTLEGVLGNLKDRYEKDLIYTYTSSILVAINPFKRLDIYHNGVVKHYKGKRIGITAPHIYAIAEATYSAMVEHKTPQSVLVSGESGAGKTESTKLILQFLSARTDRKSSIETKVLESIPVLEALGNAKTGRNDNSSRFGKFIQIQFDEDYYIIGSKIIPYLLEKSRIIFPHEGERNYHVFYQMTVGMSDEEKATYFLKTAKDYRYLSCTSCVNIKGMDESAELEAFKQALKLFDITEEIQTNMFKVLAAVLHLGNTTFKADGDKAALTTEGEAALKNACTLLEVPVDDLFFALVNKKIKMRNEIIHKPLSAQQARSQTDAFAKYLYSTLFDWQVDKLNECTQRDIYHQFIGVLDIFGFEKFDLNSLEQFLINLANEKLQQFFNHHIFKLEQQIYEAEKIDWTQISFKDNQECLDLIEKRRPPGILSILDEESKFPRATDETLIEKLHNNFDKKHDYYDKPRLKRRHFGVKHYAGLVEYDIEGWRDKNKDEVPENLSSLIQTSANKFIAILYTKASEEKAVESKEGKKDNKLTVGANFKLQLNELMTMLGTTEPYFIRCVKPNMDKVPDKFDDQLIHDQLLYAGMMETISIRRMGYPIRYTLSDFWKRYKVIAPEITLSKGDWKKTCTALIGGLKIKIPEDTQVGLTKVFLKQDIANELEDKRNLALTSTISLMQTWWRMAAPRVRFVEQRKGTAQIQTWWRMASLRKKFVAKSNGAFLIQTWMRMIWAMKRRNKLAEKKRKAEEARRKKEEEERKKKIAKMGKEAVEAEEAEQQKKEAEKIRAAAAGLTIGEEPKKKEEPVKSLPKKKSDKKDKMQRTKSIMMKKNDLVEIPIHVDGKIIVGLGWKGGEWDMDASCLLFRYKQHKDDVYYYKPRSNDGSIVHRGGYTGIIRTKAMKGDAVEDVEQIEINLHKISPKTNTLLFVVTVFSPDGSFKDIENPYVRIMDQQTQDEYCRYNIEQTGNETAKIMCKLYRYGFSRWRLKAIGEGAHGRLYKHMIKQVDPFLDAQPPKRRFKVKIHRGKLRDSKATYKGQAGTSLNTFCEIRYDTFKAKSKVIKKALEPQWRTAREFAGYGEVIEINVKHHVRFGKELLLARCCIVVPSGMNVSEKWFKIEPMAKARARGANSVTGEIKLSITETTPGVKLLSEADSLKGKKEDKLLSAPSSKKKRKK